MQVSQQSDSITHAVLGKKNSVEMGVSDSAALMHIFSTTLYTYPMLAAVREIICNGWDGHITVGKTDIPLEITINTDELIIRDFGPGIPDEKIGPIYGVFGNSTKRDDSTVTGGFGLGSKAPFAYTDNFEVTSHHGGLKTVYRISKSSMERQGKPTIDTMVQVPSTETGIQVRIRLTDSDHCRKFHELVTEVLVLGEIKARINGDEPVETLPLSESDTGFIISGFSGTLTKRINLRYGNVVYPVPRNEYYGEMWDQVSSIIRRNLWDTAQVTFMAPPDTVTIAPSREALIFTQSTEETIKNLLMNFNPGNYQIARESIWQIHREKVKKAIIARPGATCLEDFNTDLLLPAVKGTCAEHASGPYAFTVRKAAIHQALSSQSTTITGKAVLQDTLKHAIYMKTVDKHVGKKMLKAIKSNPWSFQSMNVTDRVQVVLQKFVNRPLLKAVTDAPFMELESLTYAKQRWTSSLPNYVPVNKYKVSDSVHLMGFLFKRVLLTRSKKAMNEFFEEKLRENHYNGINFAGWVVYQLPKNPKHHDDIKKVFEDLGYEVTVRIPEPKIKEVDPNAPEKVTAERKAPVKRPGYLTLRSSKNSVGNYLLTHARTNCKPDEHVKDPIAYVVLNNANQWCDRFADLNSNASDAVNELFGDKIAVVTTNQIDKLKAKGILPVSKFIHTYVDDTLSASADFKRYLAFAKFFPVDRRDQRGNGICGVIRYMLQHKDLMDSLDNKLRFSISAETETLIQFFEDDSYRGSKAQLPKCCKLEHKVKQSPKVDEVMATIKASPWLKFIELDMVGKELGTKLNGDPSLAVPYEIVRNLMK